jgi:hypothetical protein
MPVIMFIFNLLSIILGYNFFINTVYIMFVLKIINLILFQESIPYGFSKNFKIDYLLIT